MKPIAHLHQSPSSILVWIFVFFVPLSLKAQPPQDYDIYLYNFRTGAVNQLTSIPDRGEFNPSFSKFGHAVVHDVVDFNTPAHDLYITFVSTGTSIPLRGGEGGNDAAWAPHGLFIAFDRANNVALDPSIYYVSVLGGPRQLIRENAVDPDWSPLGLRVVFQDNTDGSLRTRNIFTGNETIVVPFGVNPVWSPNGKYIAYTDGNNLFKIRVTISGVPLGSPQQITFDDPVTTFNQQPSWSRDSRTLVFHSNRVTGDFDLWKVSVSGGTPVNVTGQAGNGDFDPDVSYNRKLIAFAGFTSPTPAPVASTAGYRLAQNYPNPFRDHTQLEFELPKTGWVQLDIYSQTGQLVRTLVQDKYRAGIHKINWDGLRSDGTRTAPGLYLYTLSSGDFKESKIIIVDN